MRCVHTIGTPTSLFIVRNSVIRHIRHGAVTPSTVRRHSSSHDRSSASCSSTGGGGVSTYGEG